jgi:hypothetical protein
LTIGLIETGIDNSDCRHEEGKAFREYSIKVQYQRRISGRELIVPVTEISVL